MAKKCHVTLCLTPSLPMYNFVTLSRPPPPIECNMSARFNVFFIIFMMKYVGDPIDCIHDVSGIDSNTFDTFCWVEGTYTKRYSDVTTFNKYYADL